MVYCKKVLCGIITWPTQLCGVSQYPFLIFYFKIFFPLSWSLCKTYDSTSSAISFRLIPKPRLANWTIHTFKLAVSSSLKWVYTLSTYSLPIAAAFTCFSSDNFGILYFFANFPNDLFLSCCSTRASSHAFWLQCFVCLLMQFRGTTF